MTATARRTGRERSARSTDATRGPETGTATAGTRTRCPPTRCGTMWWARVPCRPGHTCSVEHFRLLSVLHVKSAGGCVFFPSFSVLPRHCVVGGSCQCLTRLAVENKRVCGTVCLLPVDAYCINYVKHNGLEQCQNSSLKTMDEFSAIVTEQIFAQKSTISQKA